MVRRDPKQEQKFNQEYQKAIQAYRQFKRQPKVYYRQADKALKPCIQISNTLGFNPEDKNIKRILSTMPHTRKFNRAHKMNYIIEVYKHNNK